MPRLFDAYVMVDWSAASTPKTGKDSIWIAELSAQSGRTRFNNRPTRSSAYDLLEARLSNLTSSGQRVLLGVDFSLGYPAGTASALGLNGPPWRAMHGLLSDSIEDTDDNTNNRYAVAAEMNARISGEAFPFWGITSKKHAAETLALKKTGFAGKALPELRIAERYLREAKFGAPKSVWQLAYIGSVGSQSLMGIPRIQQLRERFPRAKLWPFETGFQAMANEVLNDTQILVAEIYPSLIKATPKNGEPLDKAQVRAIARHYWELDKSGQLGAAFAPPEGLNTANISNIDAEEGWILGISPITIGNLGF